MNEFLSRALTGVILVVAFCGAYLHSYLLFALLLVVVFLVVLSREWPSLVPFSGFGGVLFTFLYPGVPMLALLGVHFFYYESDFYLPLYPFAIGWVADTFGYLVGSLCGRTKICPTISPGKSWEGLAGSLVSVFIFNLIFLPKLEVVFAKIAYQSYGAIGILSVFLTAVAFLGGLLVSIFKRSKNLKDAGNVLPGHGGFLDRFDSIFALVIFIGALLFVPKLKVFSQQLKTFTSDAYGQNVPSSSELSH